MVEIKVACYKTLRLLHCRLGSLLHLDLVIEAKAEGMKIFTEVKRSYDLKKKKVKRMI